MPQPQLVTEQGQSTFGRPSWVMDSWALLSNATYCCWQQQYDERCVRILNFSSHHKLHKGKIVSYVTFPLSPHHHPPTLIVHPLFFEPLSMPQACSLTALVTPLVSAPHPLFGVSCLRTGVIFLSSSYPIVSTALHSTQWIFVESKSNLIYFTILPLQALIRNQCSISYQQSKSYTRQCKEKESIQKRAPSVSWSLYFPQWITSSVYYPRQKLLTTPTKHLQA